jgi:hypothetical protein
LQCTMTSEHHAHPAEPSAENVYARIIKHEKSIYTSAPVP